MDDKSKQKLALLKAQEICDLCEIEGRDFTGAERKQVADLLTEARGLKERMTEEQVDRIQQDQRLFRELTEGPGTRHDGGKAGSWSAAFFKGLSSFGGRKDLLPTSGMVGVPNPITGLATLADVGRAETCLQFIPREPVGTTDAVSYLRETERTHRAAPVEIGEQKPISTYTLERVDDRIKTIAHLSEPISRNWLSDAPMLRQYLDGVLREGLMLELEDQVLNGTGLGEDFLGVVSTPLVQVQPFVVSMIQTARRAITLLEDLPATPTGFVFHPNDWQEIELFPDLVGGYVMGQGGEGLPVDRARRRLWGLPVALSVRTTEGQAILGDWTGGSRLWPRAEVVIDWSEAFLTTGLSDYDVTQTTGFSRNLVQFRAELRSLFTVLIPRRFVVLDLESGS